MPQQRNSEEAMTITIPGQTPALKNMKGISCRNNKPAMYTKKAVKDWNKSALQELALKYKGQAEGRVQIDYMFYVVDDRRRDIDNMVCSVNDLLQDAGLIKNDDWNSLRVGSADAQVDKDNPRAELTIRDIE